MSDFFSIFLPLGHNNASFSLVFKFEISLVLSQFIKKMFHSNLQEGVIKDGVD